jgi:bifunctional DNA-binding transcriptional regulator/antitoxin component of YhaV-PrlF toxin-antitoxin module
MCKVTISNDFAVTLPQSVRDELGLYVGQRLAVASSGERVYLVPLRSAADLRGSLRGISTDLERDEDRLV